MATSVPIADGLFTWPSDDPQLIGSRCNACRTATFPAQQSCPKCTGFDTEEFLLSRTGTLWSFTVQGFPPPRPPYEGPDGDLRERRSASEGAASDGLGGRGTPVAQFEPYGVGYVELPGEVMVESRLTVSDPARLQIGAPMELVIVPFNNNVTFAFKPVGA